MVRNRFSKGVRFRVPAPSGKAKIYEERILEDGTMGLVHTGDHDLVEFVDAPRESSLIYNILDRFQKTGDPSLFDKSKGFFADVTDMPRDLMEAQNLLLSIDKKFSQLPSDLKDKFENNSRKFAESVLNGSFEEVLTKPEKSFVDSLKNDLNTGVKPEGEVK